MTHERKGFWFVMVPAFLNGAVVAGLCAVGVWLGEPRLFSCAGIWTVFTVYCATLLTMWARAVNEARAKADAGKQ